MQNDWIDHLPMAKFAANNHINASTRLSLFFANNGFYLCMGVKIPQIYEKTNWRAELLKTDQIVINQKAIATFLQN